ncbi:hypothetical protein PsYK624_035170 [Phanerochaete sordida]|uniref:Uncharacterized protein n=1 Tax=Phanerochaete sordida TaxID=48140 RepID=A0A9P3G3Z3_9APHY|nr:hypothetical protein PsYK624_035170 [Phanerochaete sordida]
MSVTSRPGTPDSPRSLRKVTATIDDLTAALSNFNRVPSPEPPDATTCCCGREDCESSRAWAALKNKLEGRLILSAEVGQALLERHEAFVRRHESGHSLSTSISSIQDLVDDPSASRRTQEEVDARVAELVRENAVLEKRLSQALVNSEVIDLTHQSTLEELRQAQEKIAQLSAQNVRYVGIDSRLASALQQKDDMHQERNSAVQSAKLAEARIASLKEKCAKLQEQVSRLRDDLEAERSHRRGISEDIIKDARERLRALHQAHLGQSADDHEVDTMLESLVADNESLKRDNSELQHMLDETREELRTLQEEVDEHRAGNSSTARHHDNNSITSSLFDDSATLASPFRVGTAPATSMLTSMFANQPQAGPSREKRASSSERFARRVFEPLTPDSTRRPLSPVVSGTKTSAFGRSRYAPSHRSLDLDENDPDDPESPIKPTAHKSLLLLTRSRAVQTDEIATPRSSFRLAPLPHMSSDQPSPHDAQSDSSTLADANPSVIGVVIDRTASLLNRMVQADALTLTTRLKRQNLLGADVSHLSRSTVNSILNENNALRTQFRGWLEDDKITTTCTRRDLRALFKLFKDMLAEIGQLRVTLNDVILDPSVAQKVSEMALHPSKAAAGSGEAPSAGASSAGWMAPLTKLLGLPGGPNQEDAAARALSPPVRPISRGALRPPTRVVPKREPALSATTTTVNVEFSSSAVGRAVTSSTRESVGGAPMLTASVSGSSISPATTVDSSRNVMDIFAGAPRPPANTGDPWVVIPKPPRTTSLSGRRYDLAGGATIGRAAMRNATLTRAAPHSALSRAVDAVIDNAPADGSDARESYQDTLLQRTLRPRGLSDSSIHTTFMNHDEDAAPQPAAEAQAARPDRQSVLQALSRKVQSFRVASASAAPAVSTAATAGSSAAPVPIRRATQPVSASHSGSLMPRLNLSAWATGDIDEDGEPQQPPVFIPGARGEEPGLSRGWGRGL